MYSYSVFTHHDKMSLYKQTTVTLHILNFMCTSGLRYDTPVTKPALNEKDCTVVYRHFTIMEASMRWCFTPTILVTCLDPR